jgi:hypothetical protein
MSKAQNRRPRSARSASLTAFVWRPFGAADLEAPSRELGAADRIADFLARDWCSKCGAAWPQTSGCVGPTYTGGMRAGSR